MTFRSRQPLKGVGIDLVELDRVKRFLRSHQKRLQSFLTPSEHRLFLKSKSKAKCFAFLFASKEAASKAMGITLTHPGLFKHFQVSFREKKLKLRLSKVVQSTPPAEIKLMPFKLKDAVGVLAFASSRSN